MCVESDDFIRIHVVCANNIYYINSFFLEQPYK